jgi:quercetin 2,3-dioxygenase
MSQESPTTFVPTAPRAVASPTQASPRLVQGIYQGPPLHFVGDGFRVHGYFSAIPNAIRKLSPFLMLDYHPPFDYAPTDTPRGVGVHPHRGFETVTIAWEGGVAHHDSTGAGGVIGPGDVQWMTAASGILHKEYHEKNYAKRGGPFHMAQLWVNLPKAHKMDKPRYQGIVAAEIPVVSLPDEAGTVRVIAGELAGIHGAAQTFSEVTVLDAKLRSGGQLRLPLPGSHNLAVLVMKGALTVRDQPNQAFRAAKLNDFVLFERDTASPLTEIRLEAEEDTHLLILGGEPIQEPVASYGPFVMNTPLEIKQAFADFSAGKFGHLDD